MLKGSLGLIALTTLLLSGTALAQEKIKVGVTATLEGTYTVLGEDGIRGHQTALNVLGKKIGELSEQGGEGATEPRPGASDELAKAQSQLKTTQWLLPLISGIVVVMGAKQGEMQRPTNVKKGLLKK